MKIDCNRALLATAMGIVGSVIPSKTPKPILQSVLLEVARNKASLIGTDSEISIRHDVSDVVCSGGESVLLPAKRVREVLNELREERVSLYIEEKKLQICGDRSKFNIPTEDPAEFPQVKDFSDSAYYTIPGSALKRMIRRTVFATSTDSTHYALHGVLFDASEKLTMIATDGRRLTLISAIWSQLGKPFKDKSPIVPAKALSLLERTMPDTDDVVHLAFNANEISFKTEHATITSRLIEGVFPRYKDVVPRSHKVAIDLSSGALQGVVRQSLIFTAKESRGVDFEITPGCLRLNSQAADVGTGEVELPIGYDGEPVTIRLDPRYMSEFLKTLPNEFQISLKVTDEDSPAVITTDDGSVYVIMPLAREV